MSLIVAKINYMLDIDIQNRLNRHLFILDFIYSFVNDGENNNSYIKLKTMLLGEAYIAMAHADDKRKEPTDDEINEHLKNAVKDVSMVNYAAYDYIYFKPGGSDNIWTSLRDVGINHETINYDNISTIKDLSEHISQTTVQGMLLYSSLKFKPYYLPTGYEEQDDQREIGRYENKSYKKFAIENIEVFDEVNKLTNLNVSKCTSHNSSTKMKTISSLREGGSCDLIIPDDNRIIVIGDIHSSIWALSTILPQYMDNTKNKLKRNTHIIFLGDLVDRGPLSLEIIVLVFKLKVDNPDNVHIINGNHEHGSGKYTSYTGSFDFYHETQRQLITTSNSDSLIGKVEFAAKIWETIQSIFSKMQTYLCVKHMNKRYFMSHGGYPVKVESNKIIPVARNDIDKNLKMSNNQFLWNDYSFNKDTDVSSLRWREGKNGLDTYRMEHDSVYRDRAIFMLGTNNVKHFKKMWDVDLIITGHQDTWALSGIPTDIDNANSMFRLNKDLHTELYTVNLKKYSRKNLYRSKFNLRMNISDLHGIVTSGAFYSKWFNYTSHILIQKDASILI